MVNGNLPYGWTQTTLGEATKPMQKRVNPQDYPTLPYIGMENVEAHTMRLLGTIPSKEMKSAADTFAPGDVLYGRLRPYLNKVYLPEFEGLCSTEFIIFRKVPHIHSRYLQYFLNSWEFMRFANSLNAGDRPRVKFEQLADYSFPLPPLPEQERIVAKIEELFTQLEAGMAALKRVQAGVKRYKASVLKAAVSGRLVNGNLGIGDGELPDGWTWATMEDISEQIVDCLHTTPKFVSEGKYCIDTTCIEPGKILFQKARLVSDETFQDRIRRLKPESGDILFAREGTIGTTVVVPENVDLCLGQRMMMFRPAKNILSEYMMWAMLSDIFIGQWKPRIIGTTSPHVNIGDVRQMRLPLPPLAEQRRIVAEVERRLSVAQEVESVVAASVARAARLRQSVLKSAFEGRLVP